MHANSSLLPCPCCGFRSISGEYEICAICFWTHDVVQERDPDRRNGANVVSLRDAQKNFDRYGCSTGPASELDGTLDDRLSEFSEFERDPNWKPLPPVKS
ncbi:MAG: CPCC family cysteine-rich protein [Pirellulales bacterium]